MAFQEPINWSIDHKDRRKYTNYVYLLPDPENGRPRAEKYYWKVSVWLYNVKPSLDERKIELYLQHKFKISPRRKSDIQNKTYLKRGQAIYNQIEPNYIKNPHNWLFHVQKLDKSVNASTTGPESSRQNSVFTKSGNNEYVCEISLTPEKLEEIVTSKHFVEKNEMIFAEIGKETLIPYSKQHKKLMEQEMLMKSFFQITN